MLIRSISPGYYHSNQSFKAKVNLSSEQRYVVKNDNVLNEMYKKITFTPTDNVYDVKYQGKEDYGYNRDYVEVSGGLRKKIYNVNKNKKPIFSATTYFSEDKNFLKSVLYNIIGEEEDEIGYKIKSKMDLSVEELCKKYNMSVKELIEYLKTKND